MLLSTSVATQATPRNPESIPGYDRLSADLNNDGHVERVSLVGKEIEGDYTMGGTWDAYQIVVKNDQGKIIWRSPDYPITFAYGAGNCKSCLLADLDGDGCQELVLVSDQFGSYRHCTYAKFYPPYRVYTWKNQAFRDYAKTEYGDTPYVHICKGSDGIFRLSKSGSSGGTNNELYHLRRVNGQLWGDIIIKDNCTEQDVKRNRSAGVRVDSDKYGPTALYKTARLEPYHGGLKVVEYKKS